MNHHALPIDALLPAITTSLSNHPRLILEAPPGAGKTTQVPLALLDAPWLNGRSILLLEPRRVAARNAALFMARQCGEEVGGLVGYHIRFESKVSARTRIHVVTEGILTRIIQDDPLLDGIGALLFDEFHERHLASDLGLALALDVQTQLREDLRIVVMSATLQGQRLAQFLDAPRLTSEGRAYPITITHFPARRDESLETQARRAIQHALDTHQGDVLTFLPGQREIARLQAILEKTLSPELHVMPLHGELPLQEQTRVLEPDQHGRRRIVLATNVAESSITLPGISVVIDSGLAREPAYDPNTGFTRLDVVSITQASADQRAGRAGRLAPGWAYRLWPQSQRLEAQRRPEIIQTELSGLALELTAWGSSTLRFIAPPPSGALSAARELLQRLGAISNTSTLTPLGKRMLALGIHPRLAAMLLAPHDPQEQALACDLAALLDARDPLRGSGDALISRWRALAELRSGCLPHDTKRSTLKAIDATTHQWRRRIRCDATPPDAIEAHTLGNLLTYAFPERIAARHSSDPLYYVLANGRRMRLLDNSALHGEPWIIASELHHGIKDIQLLCGAPLDERKLHADFPERFIQHDVIRWETDKRALVAQRESCFDRIVLDVRPAGRIDPVQAANVLTGAVRTLGLDTLSWTEHLRQWQARAVALRHWMPELELPDLSNTTLLATLDTWLRPAFAGKTRLDALDEAAFEQAVKSLLSWTQHALIDRHVPAHIIVPSGMGRHIDYGLADDGTPQPPVLSVKLQELFGLPDTPRIAKNRIPLTLHLLSPGGRPLQVTQDLKSFWTNTYPEVKKEMKGRYPKHPWPDDPWTATATHRTKSPGK
ncbi:ATP-dependent helicase HrpB [Xylella fastidiosa subsp. morus]|uniref:ATP-dependent helicase HrpB n=1 Tax=Xylella fastidiosa TaxID=2371 RepID=UPI001F42E3C9|nr:ATP-dependent helicase HrpB [Xylella fastidiosa]UIT36228.1 ATP-dependent helicase HrpB [Xylella fastidiosa subsp. morus]UIT38521.1 ATP-dependent helicase HrpB [Xylella fastidiosa subsp. morus]